MEEKELIVFDLVMNNYVDDYFDYNTLMATCKDLYYIGNETKKRKNFYDEENPFDQLMKKFSAFQPNITHVLSLGYFCHSFFKIPVEEYNEYTLKEFSLRLNDKTYKLVKNKLSLPIESLMRNIELDSIHDGIIFLPFIPQYTSQFTETINEKLFKEFNVYDDYLEYIYKIRSANQKILMYERTLLLFNNRYSTSNNSKEELRLLLKKVIIDNIDKEWDLYSILHNKILQASDITKDMLKFF